ncbi:MAG: hypothetical protein RR968_03350, partial [Vagococcus sp.]
MVDEEHETSGKSKKKINTKIILIVTISIVCVVAATAGTILGNMLSGKDRDKGQVEAVEKKYNKDEVSVPLEEFLVNLADNKEGETSY